MHDVRTIAESILSGEFSIGELSDDNKVRAINEAAHLLKGQPQQSEAVLFGANNLMLWLGGLSKDLRCYGVQLVLKYHAIMFAPDDKSQERINTVMDKVVATTPYEAQTIEAVTKYNWPKVFTNTYEERVEALADDVAAEDTDDVPPVDLILTGRERPADLDVDNTMRLIHACLEDLKATLDKYQGKPNILYYERLNHFYSWLLEIESLECAIMGMRLSLTEYQLPVKDRATLTALPEIAQKFAPFIR